MNHSDYHDYTAALIRGTQTIQQHDFCLFRVGKTTIRTRNDPMTANYLGADQFNSMLEPAVPKFFGQLGQPEDYGSVAYTNGTLITDSLLGMKYYLTPTKRAAKKLPDAGQRPDLKWYRPIKTTTTWQILRSPFTQSLGFVADTDLLKQPLYSETPLANQSLILQSALGKSSNPYFTPTALEAPQLTGVRRV